MNKIILTNQNTTKNLNPVKKESKKIKTKTDFTFETQTIHFDSTNKKEKSFDSYSSQQKEGKNDWKQKIQSKPVNYFDSVKNQYEKVNLQFKEDDSSFYNETNTYKSKFLKQNEQGAIFNLNEELILKSVHCKNIAPKINQNEVLYQNIFDGVDLKYTIESNQVKETLIINKKRENYEFEFEMQLNGLNAEYDEESNRILLSKDGQTKYWIASPFMIDAAYHQSEECEIQIEQIGDLLKIKCLADKNWINHNHRVFPVTIDPTIGISVEEPTIQVQYKKVANGIISDSNSPYVGYAENVYYSASILLNMSKCQAH